MTRFSEEERKQQSIEMMRLRREENMTLQEIAKEFGVSYQTVKNRIDDFQDYEKTKEKVYEELGKERQHASKEQVLEDVREIADRLGRLPTSTELEEEMDYTASVAAGRFGTTIDAYEAAGILNEEYIRVTVPEYAELSRDDFREALQEINERTEGERMKYSDYADNRDDSMPAIATIEDWYGSWPEALIDAGIKPLSVPSHFSDTITEKEKLLDALREVADKLETTSYPEKHYRMFREICAKQYPDSMTIIKRFGSWNEAKSEAGLDENVYRPGKGE